MKALILSNLYPSPPRPNFGLFVHQQAMALRELGCEVRVVCPVPWAPFPLRLLRGKWRAYAQTPPAGRLDGIEILYPRYLSFPRSWFLASSGRRVYRGIRTAVTRITEEFPFDVLHAHVMVPNGSAAARLAAASGKPLVVTVHGEDLQQTAQRNARCRRALVSVFRAAARVIVVSAKLEAAARSMLGPSIRATVIGNGVDPRCAAVPNAGLATRYAGRRIVLSVSHLMDQKGIGLNLQAVSALRAEFPDLLYLVIGDGPRKDRYRRLAHRLDLERHVAFLGELPHAEAMEHMALAEIFCLPAWNEAFGIAYLEAALHGKPVVACRGEGIGDVLADGETGYFVKPRDLESLTACLRGILLNSDDARAVGQRAAALVRDRHSWDRNAREYMRVYKEAAAHAS